MSTYLLEFAFDTRKIHIPQKPDTQTFYILIINLGGRLRISKSIVLFRIINSFTYRENASMVSIASAC